MPPAPSHEGAQQVWRPLPNGDYSNWAPLEDPWEMPEALRRVRNENEIVMPLPDDCVERLRDLWHGRQDQPSSGHPFKGAAHFHCYPVSSHSAWKDWEGIDPASASRGIWWCSSLLNAAQHYSWTKYKGGSLEQLAAALQSAMRRPNRDATLAAVVCLKILDWGGVRKRSEQTINWLDAALSAGTLIGDLEKAASLLCPRSTASLTSWFGAAYPLLPMNSGSTKIFSAAAMDFSAGYGAPKQDVLIFDRRVSVGLGFLARELSCPNTVPDEFLFPYDEAINKRDSRCPSCAPFPRMSAVSDVARAEFARNASRCIQQILGNYQPSADFVSAEKALFMIGYDVRNTCSGANRVCRAGAGNAQPRPRKRQPRVPAPSAISGTGHTTARPPRTLGRGAPYSYTGTPARGTHLTFGDDRNAHVSAAEYAALRAHFLGMRVAIGASRTDPPEGSLGAWLQANLPGLPAIASYVAPILIEAGWATKVDNRTIQFV